MTASPFISLSWDDSSQLLDKCSVAQHEIGQQLKFSGIIEKINSKLNATKSRPEGLLILCKVFPLLTKSLFKEQCETWLRLCLAVSQGDSLQTKILVCWVVGSIMKEVEFVRDFHLCPPPSKHILEFVDFLLSSNEQWAKFAFFCLGRFLKTFPGQCLQSKNSILQKIFSAVDSDVDKHDTVVAAGQAFALIPLVGMGGSISRADLRGNQLDQLIAEIHRLLDLVYDGVMESETYSMSREHNLPFEELSKLNRNLNYTDIIKVNLKAVMRILNLFTFVKQLLVGKYNASLVFVPFHLLSPIFRILQVTPSMVSRYKGQEYDLLAFVLPLLHQETMKLMNTVLESIGSTLDIHWNAIQRIILMVLKNSSEEKVDGKGNTNEVEKNLYSRINIKCCSFNTLKTLIRISSGRHSCPAWLASEIVSACTPVEDSLTLQARGSGLSSMKIHKKSKSKGYTVDNSIKADSAGINLHDLDSTAKLHQSALELAQELLTCSFHSMSHKFLMILQSGILNLSKVLLADGMTSNGYNKSCVRKSFYQTLIALAYCVHPHLAPPYVLIVNLLHFGIGDSSPEVKKVCQDGLSALSFILANPQVTSYIESVNQLNISTVEQEAGNTDECPSSPELEKDMAETGASEIESLVQNRSVENITDVNISESVDEQMQLNCEEHQHFVDQDKSSIVEEVLFEDTSLSSCESLKTVSGDSADSVSDVSMDNPVLHGANTQETSGITKNVDDATRSHLEGADEVIALQVQNISHREVPEEEVVEGTSAKRASELACDNTAKKAKVTEEEEAEENIEDPEITLAEMVSTFVEKDPDVD